MNHRQWTTLAVIVLPVVSVLLIVGVLAPTSAHSTPAQIVATGTVSVYLPQVRNDPPPSPTPTTVPTPTATPDYGEMILISAGTFQMGCDANNTSEECYANEQPLHTVNLGGYYIDKYEVTNGRYKSCVDAGVCTAPQQPSSSTRPSYYDNPAYVNYPVIKVTWNQADTFCRWQGKRTPTEAQWEKAARGNGDARKYPWGNTEPNCSTSATYGCVSDTAAVGSFPNGASPYGILDMAGNVREWVNDWYAADYYSISPTNNPQGPTSGTGRVLRGGSWGETPSTYGVRLADRHYRASSPSSVADLGEEAR